MGFSDRKLASVEMRDRAEVVLERKSEDVGDFCEEDESESELELMEVEDALECRHRAFWMRDLMVMIP